MRGAGEEEGLNFGYEAMRGKCLGVKARAQSKGSKEALKNEQGQRQRPGVRESAAAGERGDQPQSWGGGGEGVGGGGGGLGAGGWGRGGVKGGVGVGLRGV